MKKIIKELNAEGTQLQVTIADERWYSNENKDGEIVWVPSVTWISGKYPKGTQFYKWLAQKGWDEAEAIKSAAGDKGSKVHYAVTDLINGLELNLDAKYTNPSTGLEEELTLEEWECLMSFVSWFNEVQPKTIANEFVVFGDSYAGTVDYLCEIDGERYLIDFKTSQQVWAEYELQVSAYKHALADRIRYQEIEHEDGTVEKKDTKLAILQLGYKLNKKKYKFTEVDDKFELFRAAQLIWANEHAGENPIKREYPTKLTLNTTQK